MSVQALILIHVLARLLVVLAGAFLLVRAVLWVSMWLAPHLARWAVAVLT